MFENIIKFFKNLGKKEKDKESSDTAKERLHLVLMQDRANVSADFLELMRQEIIEVIKKYIDIDEKAIDVRLTNKTNDDGTVGAPALYANIPIITIKDEARKANVPHNKPEEQKNKEDEGIKKEEVVQNKEESKQENKEDKQGIEKNSKEAKQEEKNKRKIKLGKVSKSKFHKKLKQKEENEKKDI